MNVRRRNPIGKWIKDYMVPIIWFLFILILMFSLFSWNWDTTKDVDLENKVWLELKLDGLNTESYIVYPWDYKKKIEWSTSLYKWEKVTVKDGSVTLTMNWIWSFKVNKLWEFKYLESWDFSLDSSDLWLNSTQWANINMTFARVKVAESSNISFSQNEMWSTIYLLNWFAEVENLAWESTVLASGQKITISRLNANNEDIDLSLLKENIDDYYKQSDWFIKNNWASFLNMDKTGEKTTSTWSTTIVTNSKSGLISFNNLSDESNVSSDTIDILWKISSEDIVKITLNWSNAVINKEAKTFKFEKVSVPNKENDLVFKVIDDANDLLSKFIYTIYYDWWAVKNNTNSAFKVKTFDVDGSKFIFTTIKDSWISKSLNGKTTYTTYWDFLTIYWKVTAKGIKSISVDWYELKSFNGSSWRYHPSILNNNLNKWTNVYEIKYYWDNKKILYTNHFTIIKKDVVVKKEVPAEVKKVEETEKYSDEAKIN